MNMHILGFLVTGMLVGMLLRKQGSLLWVANRLMTWSLYLMVFLLGSSVGGNHAVIDNLGRLGFQAFLLCAGGIVGSVCAARLVSTRCFKPARYEE